MTKSKIKVPEKELWRVDEVAKFLNVTSQTVYRWCNEGKLSICRISNCVRIPRESILKLIENDPAPKKL